MFLLYNENINWFRAFFYFTCHDINPHGEWDTSREHVIQENGAGYLPASDAKVYLLNMVTSMLWARTAQNLKM